MTRPIAPPGWQHWALPVRQGPHGVRIMCLLRMRPEQDEFSLAFCSVFKSTGDREPTLRISANIEKALKCHCGDQTATDLSNMADELRMNCGNKGGKTLRVHFGRRDRPQRVKSRVMLTRPSATGRCFYYLRANGRSPRAASGSCIAQRTF